MSTYIRYPNSSASVPTYPNAASLPPTAADGQLAVTLDTDSLYIFNSATSSWVLVANPGGSLTVGALDAEAPSLDGAVIDSSVLYMQSATLTEPGLVNNDAQSFSGDKTFQDNISANNLSGTNTGDVTLGTANGLSLMGQELSLDTSSASSTGSLTSSDWSTFNSKQDAGDYITDLSGDVVANGPGAVTATIQNSAVTNAKMANMNAHTVKANTTGSAAAPSDASLGTVTEATSSVLTLTGWTDATIGSPTIQVKQASTSTSGYLSSTDWNTFNGKQASGNYITSLTGDVTASGPGAAAATIGNNKVTNAMLAQMGATTIKGNSTGGAANASDLSTATVKTMLNLSGTNSGDVTLSSFGSSPNGNGASLSGQALTLQPADSSNPGGMSTTTQDIAGAKTFVTQLIGKGTSTNDDAAAGYIGQVIETNPGAGVAPASTGNYKDICSITLTAGDWDVEGTVALTYGTISGLTGRLIGALSTTSSTADSASKGGFVINAASSGGSSINLPVGKRRFKVPNGNTQTVYLVGNINYATAGTAVWSTDNYIIARRVR